MIIIETLTQKKSSLQQELQKILTLHTLSMSYSQVTQYPSGTLATVIDQSDLVGQVMGQLGHVTRAIFMAIAYAGIMFILSPTIALAVIMVVACIWLLLNTVVSRIRRLADLAFKSRVTVWRWTIEYLSAPRLVRLFNASEQVANKITIARDLELGPDRKTDLIQLMVPKLLEIVTVVGAGGFSQIDTAIIIQVQLDNHVGQSRVTAVIICSIAVEVIECPTGDVDVFEDAEVQLRTLLARQHRAIG